MRTAELLRLVSIGWAFQLEAIRRTSNEFSCPSCADRNGGANRHCGERL